VIPRVRTEKWSQISAVLSSLKVLIPVLGSLGRDCSGLEDLWMKHHISQDPPVDLDSYSTRRSCKAFFHPTLYRDQKTQKKLRPSLTQEATAPISPKTGLRSVELVQGSCFGSDPYVLTALITVEAMTDMHAFDLLANHAGAFNPAPAPIKLGKKSRLIVVSPRRWKAGRIPGFSVSLHVQNGA
jgi:hypothetical protein